MCLYHENRYHRAEKKKKNLNSSKIYFPHDLEVKYDLDISSPIKQPNRLRVHYVIADEVY